MDLDALILCVIVIDEEMDRTDLVPFSVLELLIEDNQLIVLDFDGSRLRDKLAERVMLIDANVVWDGVNVVEVPSVRVVVGVIVGLSLSATVLVAEIA